MALITAFDHAKRKRIRKIGDGRDIIGVTMLTQFFGSTENPDLPMARLSEVEPSGISGVHYHEVDEFHIVVDGRGKLGKRELVPYYVHFARAYTPYGPLSADPAAGLSILQLCARADLGSQRLPEKRGELKQVPDRRPWQITVPIAFPERGFGTAGDNTVLRAVADVNDENGLSAHVLNMKPNAETVAPDPSRGNGQYIVAVQGSLVHESMEHQALALVFIKPTDGAFHIHAGTQGLHALILNFPCAQIRAAETTRVRNSLGTWECRLCSFVYDEAAGLPIEAIAPGTRWKDVPEDWKCPDCSASKGDFEQIAQ